MIAGTQGLFLLHKGNPSVDFRPAVALCYPLGVIGSKASRPNYYYGKYNQGQNREFHAVIQS